MSIAIDAAGRVVIPQAIRRRLGLDAGTRLEIEVLDGDVLLRPMSKVSLDTAEDGLPILRAPHDSAPLRADDVRRVVEESREWPRR
ncbi:MAG: Antidote-toxin recognition MazE, bacterial antitoxin [Pseudonocardiales bacterium]|jgi:AbrB family looped-hinge helix DNA binding protein|nr:Antidote-toxin recognition MazE, bacterial antitoxin [Pseudonocardiales bacterium]